MPRPRRLRCPRLPLVAAALLGGLSACSASEVTPQKVTPNEQAAPETKAEAKAKAEPEANKPPPLSEEDLALLAADPKDLTPELRRKRAYARRRQIMQNPDSPTARALNDLAEAHRAGEIDVKKRDGVWFSLPGTKPKHGRPPAGWRPPEDEAKSDEGTPAGKAPATQAPADATPPSDAP